MKRTIQVVALLLVAILCVYVWKRMHPSDKEVIAERVASLAERVSKPEGEGNAAMALKMNALPGLFTDTFTVDLRDFPFNGQHSATEMTSEVARARAMFSSIELTFYDVTVTLDSPDTATASFTARAQCSAQQAPGYNETREMHCQLRKVDGTWRFASFREEAVLVK